MEGVLNSAWHIHFHKCSQSLSTTGKVERREETQSSVCVCVRVCMHVRVHKRVEFSCWEKGAQRNREQSKRRVVGILERAEWDPGVLRTDSLSLLVFNTRRKTRSSQLPIRLLSLPEQGCQELRALLLVELQALGLAVS